MIHRTCRLLTAPVLLVLAVLPRPAHAGREQVMAASPAKLHVLVIGDSIPYGQGDCGYCKTFIDLFGAALKRATGRPVSVNNMSNHQGINSDDLLNFLQKDATYRRAVRGADAIVVSTGHNDPPWNRHLDICGGGGIDNDTDWSKYDAACIHATSQVFRTDLDGIVKQIRSLRAGKRTLLRMTNVYNDWIGDPHDGGKQWILDAVKPFIETYNTITCQVAQQYHAICIDLYHAFNGPDGTQDAGPLLGPDHTHPSAQGHRLIAQLLIKAGFKPLHA